MSSHSHSLVLLKYHFTNYERYGINRNYRNAGMVHSRILSDVRVPSFNIKTKSFETQRKENEVRRIIIRNRYIRDLGR